MDWASRVCKQFLDVKPATKKQYAYDLRVIARYLREQRGQAVQSNAEVVQAVIGPCAEGLPARTRILLRGFRAWALQNGRQDGRRYSQSQVRRMQATVNRLMKLAVDLGCVQWAHRVILPLPIVPPSRHCRRVKLTRADVQAMIRCCQDRQDTKGRRDELTLWLMYANGLRVGEILSIDYPDGVNISEGAVMIRPSGVHTGPLADPCKRESIELPAGTQEVLHDYLAVRGPGPGPLLMSEARQLSGRTQGITADGLRHAVGKLALTAIGRQVTPEDLRFAGIQALGRLTHGNDLWVSILSRHRVYSGSDRTWQRYQDDPVYTMRGAAEIVQSGRPWVHPSALDGDTSVIL